MKIIQVSPESLLLGNPDSPNLRGRLAFNYSGVLRDVKGGTLEVKGTMGLRNQAKSVARQRWVLDDGVMVTKSDILFMSSPASIWSEGVEIAQGKPFLLALKDRKAFEEVFASTWKGFLFDEDLPFSRELIWSLVSIGAFDIEYVGNKEIGDFILGQLLRLREEIRRETVAAIEDRSKFFHVQADLERVEFAIKFYGKRALDLRQPW